MSVKPDLNNRTGSFDTEAPAPDSSQATSSRGSTPSPETVQQRSEDTPAQKFATRAARVGEGMSNGKLFLLGGGLLVAVLFFALTATVSKSPRRPDSVRRPSQPAKQEERKPSAGSVTPLMDTARTPEPDNTSGQIGPGDIRRIRAVDNGASEKQVAAKPRAATSLGSVPSFADTQQKWEDPAPYDASTATPAPQTQQNSLKEPSIIFVRASAQNPVATAAKVEASDEGFPRLDMTPGSRIQAKLETQISSAIVAPVVAVVEYTYALGDQIVVPAGARLYGQLQQADRSGFVGVRFDEIELLDGTREKIDAIGAGLDLGPIKGNVYGRNRGKNFLVRAASGLGSVLAEVAGNNTGAAFSEDDMLRERLAENIGTAGDSEVMHLNGNTRVVVSVPADTKIYVVFTKHQEAPRSLHQVIPGAQ